MFLVALLMFANDDRVVLHVLNRVTFGPRPGDVERVRAIGLARYVDLQLHPERIPERARTGDGVGTVWGRSGDGDVSASDASPGDLAKEKVLRAVYSERQLEEVLTDFWFNHFNVDARKGPGRLMNAE